jgi:hypothetical protein
LAFDSLRERLLLGGVAPRHVRRYLRELSEHLDDLTAQQHQAGYHGEDATIRARARLGGDDELAAAMLAQKRFRSWAARAPWAVFLLLPPVAAMAIGMLFIGSLVLTAKYFGFMPLSEHSAPIWFQTLATDVVAFVNLTAKPFAAILFVAIAARQRLKLIWPLIATLLLLVLVVDSGVFFAGLPGKSYLRLGAGLQFPGWTVLVEKWRLVGTQYVMIMLPMLWLWRRRLARA